MRIGATPTQTTVPVSLKIKPTQNINRDSIKKNGYFKFYIFAENN